jgi:hypothetical protein
MKSENHTTTWIERFQQAIALLCGGNAPPLAMCESWINDNDGDHDELQGFAMEHMALPWMQGISLIDAAISLADQPEEGCDHLPRVKNEKSSVLPKSLDAIEAKIAKHVSDAHSGKLPPLQAMPKLPAGIVKHPQLGELFDRMQVHQYAVKHCETLCVMLSEL